MSKDTCNLSISIYDRDVGRIVVDQFQGVILVVLKGRMAFLVNCD